MLWPSQATASVQAVFKDYRPSFSFVKVCVLCSCKLFVLCFVLSLWTMFDNVQHRLNLTTFTVRAITQTPFVLSLSTYTVTRSMPV